MTLLLLARYLVVLAILALAVATLAAVVRERA